MEFLEKRAFFLGFLALFLAFAGILAFNPAATFALNPCPGGDEVSLPGECGTVSRPVQTGPGESATAQWGCGSAGSDRTCDYSYDFGGKGQVYSFSYHNVRNDNPTPKVYWCINNTSAWGTGVCGTIQDSYNVGDYSGGISSSETGQVRYFMVKIRVEQTFFNTNDFLGQFTIYRRWTRYNPNLSTAQGQVLAGEPIPLNWKVWNAIGSGNMEITYPDGHEESKGASTEPSSDIVMNSPGIYTFQLFFGGPSEDDGYRIAPSNAVSVDVAAAHLSCQNSVCTRVAGAGSNSCSPEGSDCSPTHLGCGTNGTCQLLPGAGSPTDGCTAAGQSCAATHLGCNPNTSTCRVLSGGGGNTDGCGNAGDRCTPKTTSCNPPIKTGWHIDACWDGAGGADCGNTQAVADAWCSQGCGKDFGALSFGTAWIEGIGTMYLPTGRTCADCSNTLSSVTCSDGKYSCQNKACVSDPNGSYNSLASCVAGCGGGGGGGNKHNECVPLTSGSSVKVCRSVDGAGSNQCVNDTDCGYVPPPSGNHNECKGDACIKVPGPGNNRCINDSNCKPSENLKIDPDFAGLRVGESKAFKATYKMEGHPSQDVTNEAGWGVDNCNGGDAITMSGNVVTAVANGACSISAHYAGNGATAVVDVSGGAHTECSWDGRCVMNDNPGENQCGNDNDCVPRTHKACSANACTVVSGPGPDQCSSDSQCGHNICTLDGACTRVSGPGDNSCSSWENCPQPPPTCSATISPTFVIVPPSRPVTLEWSAQGRGNITCGVSPAGCSGGKTGTCTVTPTSTTNYTLTCTGPGGACTASSSAKIFTYQGGNLIEVGPTGH